MKISRAILPVVILALTSGMALAEWALEEEARLVADHFVAAVINDQGQWAGSPDATVSDCLPLERGEEIIGWILPVAPQGYVLVSPLKEMPAIKAWSDESDFDLEATDGYTAMIHETLGRSIDFLRERFGRLDLPLPGAAPRANPDSWDRWLSTSLPREAMEMVGPYLPTNWHQQGPYWNDCPQGDGGTCLVGCVATSAAQIMKYWEYPSSGIGNHSYFWNGDDSCNGQAGGGVLEAYFSDPYDWDLILNNYTGGYTPEEAAAVAELNYEVAVAFEMDFGHCGSGTWVYIGEDVYPDFFRYSEDIEFEERVDNSTEQWWDLIVNELDQFPPRLMHYRIVGHSIICDGYNQYGENRYYHMNYGWGGGHNSWYSLDNLYCDWDGCDVMGEGMLVSIEPEGYFSVTSPDAETVWNPGELPGLIEWSGAGSATVVADLYKGEIFIARVLDWTDNDGSEQAVDPVSDTWGTGSNYRIKVVGDDNTFAWSAQFGIFGEGAWTDASDAPVNDAGRGMGVAWGDADGDGWIDLYASNQQSANHLYGNQSGLSFMDITAPPLDVNGYGRSPAWADYDNDGDLDLYLTMTNGHANKLFRNDGGSFTDVTSGPLGDTSYSQDGSWADYDGDGDVDLYVANVFAADKLLRNEGNDTFTDVTASPLGDGGWGNSAVWGDYDNDGDADLYLVRQSGNKLYRNNGNGTFTSVGSYPVTDSGTGYGAAWGDYDNDGDLDIYLVNDGANKLFSNDGNGSFSDVTTAPLDDAGSGHGCGWGDYDNDGWLDLYLANNGENRLFHNEGDGSFAETTDAVLGDAANGMGIGWADYDADGDLDLYLANDQAANRLFRNDDNSGNHWLQVRLVGDSSSRDGFGARIRVVAGGLSMIRPIGGDAGYLSRNSLLAEFGLGSATIIESVSVWWPNGSYQDTALVAVDQILVLDEAGASSVDPAPAVSLLSNWPNPFNPTTRISFSLAEAGTVNLDIFDLSGRLIASPIAGELRTAGTHAASWDGRNSANRELPSGIYLCRLEVGGKVLHHKLALLK